MVRTLLCLLTLLISQSVMALSQVTATVDKNPVMLKESLVLTVIADDDINRNAFDTNALLKDFIVGRTSVSSQTSIVNFNATRTTRWETLLIPRHAGTIVIPALTIETLKTTPITVTVLSAQESNENVQQDLFITSDVSSKDIYVQQLLTLSVKLHFSAELKRGSLTEPSLEGANIEQVGQDKENETIINGKRYRVIERIYSISPQKSGTFTLSSPMFSGEIMVPSTRRSNFLSFGNTKPVSVMGDEITITVRPIPESYQGQWLPSELLSLHQEWQPNEQDFVVGEPITRTITLTAAGLSKEQLPSLSFEAPNGLKIYPDQAKLHSNATETRLVSQQVRNFAIVASKAGEFVLPEIIIPWWNTVTNKYEEAKIPAQTITVQPNMNSTETAPFSPTSAAQNSAVENKTIVVTKSSNLQWLFLALWLFTSLAWLITTLWNKREKHPAISTSKRINDYHLAMLAACKQSQGEKVLTLIVPWFNSLSDTSKKVSTIDDVIKAVNQQDFSEAITHLQSCFYGKKHDESSVVWQGKPLLALVEKLNKKHHIKSSTVAMDINP